MHGLVILAAMFCVAVFTTVKVAQALERSGRTFSLPIWFLLVSGALPLVWLVLQAVAVIPMLADPRTHSQVMQRMPQFMRLVSIPYTVRLWVFSSACAAFLARSRRRAASPSDPAARKVLWSSGGAVAIALILWAYLSPP